MVSRLHRGTLSDPEEEVQHKRRMGTLRNPHLLTIANLSRCGCDLLYGISYKDFFFKFDGGGVNKQAPNFTSGASIGIFCFYGTRDSAKVKKSKVTVSYNPADFKA